MGKRQVPEKFHAANALADDIRGFAGGDENLNGAAWIVLIGGALDAVRAKMGPAIDLIPPRVLAGVVQESIVRSGLIFDVAAIILVSQGREIEMPECETVEPSAEVGYKDYTNPDGFADDTDFIRLFDDGSFEFFLKNGESKGRTRLSAFRAILDNCVAKGTYVEVTTLAGAVGGAS